MSSYGGADIFKAAGHLQTGAILLIFPPRTHHCFHCKSLSAEFLMNCTKASLPYVQACTHTLTHMHTKRHTPHFAFVHNRNGFRKEWMRLVCTQRKFPPQIDFSFFRNDDRHQALVCDRVCAMIKWGFYIFAFEIKPFVSCINEGQLHERI